MKYLKKLFNAIINSFRSIFATTDNFKESKKEAKKTTNKPKRDHRTNSEKRYDWLVSTGYTPQVNVEPDPKPDKKLTHYGAMMYVAKDLGKSRRKSGTKIMRLSKFKNKYGLDIRLYFGINKVAQSITEKKRHSDARDAKRITSIKALNVA